MRTTITGAILFLGTFLAARLGVSAVGPVAIVLVLTFFGGLGCLIVGPILWVRGARRQNAEKMDLLRQIAAQGQQPPPV